MYTTCLHYCLWEWKGFNICHVSCHTRVKQNYQKSGRKGLMDQKKSNSTKDRFSKNTGHVGANGSNINHLITSGLCRQKHWISFAYNRYSNCAGMLFLKEHTCLSPPRCINWYWRQNAGGYPALDYSVASYPGVVANCYSLLLHAT